MRLSRSRSDVPNTTPATASGRVPSSALGAEPIGTGSSVDENPRFSPESCALRLRSLPVCSLSSLVGSGGGFGEIDRLDPSGDLYGRTRRIRSPNRLLRPASVPGWEWKRGSCW
ncbi:hypothetical protein ACJZ2D_004212 [Fusarium nematophilum]